MVYLTPSFMVLLAAVFSLPEGANTAALPAGRRSSMVEMDGRDVNPSFKPFQGNIAPGQHNVAFPVAKPLIDSRSAAIQLQSTGSSSSSSDSDSSSADSDSTGPKSQSFKSRPSSSDDDEMDMDIGDSSVSADVDPGMDWVVGDSNDANSFAAQADSDFMADDMVDTPTQTSVGNQFAPRPRPVDPDAQDNAQASAWRALPCNGQMVEGVKNTGDEQANNYRYLAQPNNLAAATPTATYDDGMYHPHPATRTPGPGDGDSNPNVARSIYHSHKGDKKSSKKEPVVEGKDRFHVKGSKSFLKEGEKKGEKEGKHPHKAHGSKGSKKEILSGRDVVDIEARSLQVLGANVAMSLAGGDTALIGNSKPDGKGNLVKLNARHSDHYYDHHHHDDEHYHGHEHDHDHEHVHEHIHEHNHKRLLPGGSSGTGLAGTVGVLQPLSSLLPSGLAQQVASLVLSPLSSLTAGKSLMDTAGAANQFLLSPSTTEKGTKLILVESADPISTAMGSGDVQSNGTATNAQWKHVSLQTTIFDLASGTGLNKILCATVDKAPPSTLRMAECRPAGTDPTTSQEFLYDPVSGEIQPSMASTPAVAPVAARDSPSSAPTSVKLVFLVDATDASASTTTDSPPLLPQSMLASAADDDSSSSSSVGSSFKAAAADYSSDSGSSYGSVEDAEFTPASTTSPSWKRVASLFTRSSSKGKGHNGNKITVGNKNLNNNGRKQKHQAHKVHKNNKAFLRRDA